MHELSRRETFGMMAGAFLGTFGFGHLDEFRESKTDDYRDCINALAQNHIPELESIFLQGTFHAITSVAKRLDLDAQSMSKGISAVKEGLGTQGNAVSLDSDQAKALRRQLDQALGLAASFRELFGQKTAFESLMQDSASRLRAAQGAVTTILAQPEIRWRELVMELNALSSECTKIRQLVEFQPEDEVRQKLLARLKAVSQFVDSCIAYVTASSQPPLLIASLAAVAPVSVPSYKECVTIVSKHVNPSLWWPDVVRAVAKPAFAVVAGVQPSEKERSSMIQDGLWCINWALGGNASKIAAEVAKGGR